MGRGRSLVTKSRRRCLRRSTSLALVEVKSPTIHQEQGNGNRAWKDKHQRGMRQKIVGKYLRRKLLPLH